VSDLLIPDISRWQGQVDWNQFHPPAVIIKAGGADGGFYEDPNFKILAAAADAHKVPWIAYYFCDPGGDPHLQASHFFGIARREAVVADIESGGGDQRAFATAFCANLKNAILYTGLNHEQVDNLAGIAPTWIAAYGPNEPTVAHVLWQHTSSAHYPGIAGNVDESVFHGDLAALMRLFGLATQPIGDDEMDRLVKGSNGPEIYLIGSLAGSKRYVGSQGEVDAWQAALKALGAPVDIAIIPQYTLDSMPKEDRATSDAQAVIAWLQSHPATGPAADPQTKAAVDHLTKVLADAGTALTK
jgi:hypothetical protein